MMGRNMKHLIKFIRAVLFLVSSTGNLLATDKTRDRYLDQYPPVLRTGDESDFNSLKESVSPNSTLKAFFYVGRNGRNDELAIIGAVDSKNSILWQKATGARAISGLFWSSDSKFLIFYTCYQFAHTLDGRKVDFYAKTAFNTKEQEARDANYIYVINAETGKVVYHFDPDIFIFHFENIADPRKVRPTLLGAGSIENIDLTGNKLTVTETIVPPGFKYVPLPNNIPPPQIG